MVWEAGRIADCLGSAMREYFDMPHPFILMHDFRKPADKEKNDCPPNPYIIVHHMSTFSDHQTLKLQEAPDMVPVGELPRHMLLSADR